MAQVEGDKGFYVLDCFGEVFRYLPDTTIEPKVELTVLGGIGSTQSLKNDVMAIGSFLSQKKIHILHMGTPEHQVIEMDEGIFTVKLNNDLTQLVAGGAEGSLYYFVADADGQFEQLGTWKAHIECSCIAFLRSGNVVSGGADGILKLWEPSTGHLLGEFKHPSSSKIHALDVFQADDDLTVITADDEGLIVRWNINDGSFIELGTHQCLAFGLAVHSNGLIACSVSYDGQLICWDLTTNKMRWGNDIDIRTYCSPAFYNDEVIYAAIDTYVRSYDVNTGVMKRQWLGSTFDPRCILVIDEDDSTRYVMVKAAVKSGHNGDAECDGEDH